MNSQGYKEGIVCIFNDFVICERESCEYCPHNVFASKCLDTAPKQISMEDILHESSKRT